jgi:trehalose-6-phosphate synthase
MVSVSDNLGAISNITQSIIVNPYSTQNLDSYLSAVQQNYQQAITLPIDQQIQELNILALDYTLFDENSVQSCA